MTLTMGAAELGVECPDRPVLRDRPAKLACHLGNRQDACGDLRLRGCLEIKMRWIDDHGTTKVQGQRGHDM